MRIVRRDGRVVECTGLENRHGFIAHLGFKSLSLRHLILKKSLVNTMLFLYLKFKEYCIYSTGKIQGFKCLPLCHYLHLRA